MSYEYQNLISALKPLSLQTKNKDLQKTCYHVQESLRKQSITIEDAMLLLSEYILKFEDAVLFKNCLPNLLLPLVSAKIPLKPVFSSSNYDACNDAEKIYHLEYSVILALLSDHPDILQYVLKYFEVNPIPPYEMFIHHEEAYNVAPKKKRLQEYRQKITDKQIVQCCWTLLKKLPNKLSSNWDWSKFINNFSNHGDDNIRWMAKECMVIITNMTDAQSKTLCNNLNLSKPNELQYIHEDVKELPNSDNIVKNTKVTIGNVINIDGITLPIYNEENVLNNNLVPVKSTLNNLRSLALAVASGQAVSLMGPVGSGKTSLVEYLAAITGRKHVAFKKVQLGDQTDSRMLLGSHQCTDVPGEFVWRPGVLTEAVQNGHWLLLEDIDCAALDVASTLSSLLERNSLCVPGYRDSLPVTPGFQLFVTQRTVVTSYGFQKKMSNSSTLLQKHLTQINLEPLSRSELQEVIQILYPALSSISSRMIEVFMMFSVGSHDTSLQNSDCIHTEKDNRVTVIKGSRLTSTRDLLKWCSRAVNGFDVSSHESAVKVLQDAFDIFTSSVSSPDHRLELAKKVGTCLGIVETESEFYFKNYKPNVSLNADYLEVGRARVPRKEKSLETVDFDNKQVVFSFTRQSACLLRQIACSVMANEPVLLVGETGTGKTSSIQYLARQTGHRLIVINMNQQSDSADLLGGYKPVDLKYVIRPIKNEFETHFRNFYNTEKNKKFLGHIETCYESENWVALLALMKQSQKAAVNRLLNEKNEKLLSKWLSFGQKLSKLEQQIKAASRLTFAFIEGSLVKAMQNGDWVLLDEINLASAEILECLAGLLEDKNESIDLLEKGDKVPIKRHPEFTLFACMNPATDVGKKDLPVGLRNRFTEFFIDELTERNDLTLLIGDYLYHMNLSGSMMEEIYRFYDNVRKEARLSLVDGAGNAPHYSLRTLCRALTAAAKAKCGTVSRSLYEAFCLSFLTQLDSSSHPKVEAMIAKAVIGKKSVKSVLNQLIPEPQVAGQNFLLFENHWILQGKLKIDIPEGYILTPTVRKNLRDIARIISLGRLPILLQGDTSVGKTSLITYIAKASGNYCVRINNHEHTDLQEYIGSYASDACGKLVFKEGVLVEAMRKGYWIILDELNLAPSDVLEALNRVLDDNRELFIPETQQVVKADPNFMLFATQNPPGLYGGRKMLSRAFRNRFVELHFDEIPKNELETILHRRCHLPPTYSKKMIAVMAELQLRRRGSAAVQGKDGFITLRDLFRWGQRYKCVSKEMLTDDKFYDWDQHIADEGYLILAGKVRQNDERCIIEQVIEKHIKRKVNVENLFNLHQATSSVTKSILEMILNNELEKFSHIVWTYNMRRLAVLIAKAFTFDEPVLLVGETGCGKTTICQVLATIKELQLLTVNCHMHTESSDFLGGLRPVRQYKNDGRLFEWVDGPLIKAMETGNIFLADEISLADDSVLERLNSLLEPERQLVLAERGMDDSSDIVVIKAEKNFYFVGTMNPGGDFGKKELSPALRNRFTEIWCDSTISRDDLLSVLEKSVNKGISLGNQEDGSSGIGNSILDFTDWLKTSEVTNKFPFSIRDLLSWVHFINTTVSKKLLDTPEAYVHGACMTFLDCFGTALTGHIETATLASLRQKAINFLLNQIDTVGSEYTVNLRQMLIDKQTKFVAESDATKFGIKPFYIETGESMSIADDEQKFTFTAPTTGSNTLRLLRGLQLNKAILLEGNPGVGKTSLVTALAKSSGHRVIRINLSDQTDITDLFGTDLPTEDGSFTFKEGAFLNALQNGDWILLDELNLAPQPVLEGLNACLDHRGEVYIPELGKTFKVKTQTKLFACQNPLKQGGARRGLPISFLNRFTQVYIDTLTKEDLIYIVESQYSSLPKEILYKIVEFNCKVSHEVIDLQSWGHRGAPWEMNLRDIQRWCEALLNDVESGNEATPGKFVDMLYTNRMRTIEDKEKIIKAYDNIFSPEYPRSSIRPQFDVNDTDVIIGDVTLSRNVEKSFKNRRAFETNLLVLRHQLPSLKALAQNIKMNWLTILVGPTATGKSSIVQVLADLTGNDLQVVPVTSAMDVSDLLGGFEQADYNRKLESLYDNMETLTLQTVRKIWLTEKSQSVNANRLLSHLRGYRSLQSDLRDSNKNLEEFNEKINLLLKHGEKLIEYNTKHDEKWNKLQNMTKQLKDLKQKLSKMRSVNTGGKFEWIDSLLVKTMVEGSWLLLDNVNLTSAAVLDRLNGLLEPNGVLSIPERGEICEIKPHSDFRVFFTMDPKYGEISRAMRNRGVEMFLLKSDDWNSNLKETISHMDLSALLSSTGLPEQYHELCIKSHEVMTSFIQGLDRPTLSHLLQAALLSWQQIVRGITSPDAFITSFSDVYIKPRCGTDFASNVNTTLAEMKNNMLQSLSKLIEENEYIPEDNSNISHTISVKRLCINSSYEKVKQIVFIPKQQTIHWQTVTEEALNVFSTIFTAAQKCPSSQLQLLHAIICKEIVAGAGNKLDDLVNKLNDQILYLRGDSHTELFERFYPECYKLDDQKLKEINTSTILLYNDLWQIYGNCFLPEKNMSAMDYSKAVAANSITDDFIDFPILKYCQKYLKLVDQHLEDAVKCAHNLLDDQITCKLMILLNWRSRFVKMCSTPLFVAQENKAPILKEEVVSLLYMHSKWLQRRLLGELFKLSPNNKMLDKFNKDSKLIVIKDDDDNANLAKLAKKLRKLNGQPNLYENEVDYDLCVRRSEMYCKTSLDLEQPLDKQLQKLNVDPFAICDSYFDIPQTNVLARIETHVSDVLTKSPPQDGLTLRLIPINAYINQRVLNLLKRELLKITSKLALNNTSDEIIQSEFAKLISHFVYSGKEMHSFGSAFLDILSIVRDTLHINKEKQCISTVPVTFWEEFYKVLVQSPAMYPLPFFELNDVTKTDVQEIPINTKRVSSNSALLPFYIQKLTISINEDSRHVLAFETVSLKDRSEYSNQLSTSLNILWKNISTLDSAAVTKLRTDALFEMEKYEKLISHLHSILSNESIIPTTNLFQATSEYIEQYLKGQDQSLFEMFLESNALYSSLQKLLSVKQLENNEKIKVRMMTSQLSLFFGLLSTKLVSEMSSVDHIVKCRLKMQYVEEDIKVFDALLAAYYMQGLVSGTIFDGDNIERSSEVPKEYLTLSSSKSEDLKAVHPYCSVILQMKQDIAEKVKKYSLGNTFRPQQPTYNSFAKDCKHFTKSMLSPTTIKEMCANLIKTSTALYELLLSHSVNKAVIQKAHTVRKEIKSWLYSVKAFYKKIENTYSEAFPDLAKPLQSSLAQLIYAVTSLSDTLKEVIVKIEQGPALSRFIKDLIEYPNNLANKRTKKEHIDRFISSDFVQLLKRNVIASTEDSSIANSAYIQVLKMNLSELKMYCTAKESIDAESFTSVVATLDTLVKTWEEQQREIEQKKQDDEALYVTKSKCEDEDEVTVANEEIQEMFPSYSDSDFSEFKPTTLEQKPVQKCQDNKPKSNLLINSGDVTTIYKWHSNFIKNMTAAEWLPSPKKLIGNDVITSFVARYPLFSQVMQNCWEALDAEFEGDISPSLMVLISQIKDKVDGQETSGGKVDFYKSPWVSETLQCVPLLQNVKEKTNELLNQWPDFPSLKDIIVIVDRISNFPVTSPVSRFLTGLELLRDKVEEWNKNAHKGNNMVEISLAIGQQIVNWRKLEMGHWKECLNNIFHRKQAEAHKYWFYLYSVIESYLEAEAKEPVPASRVVAVLREFMESSNLVEYEVRLDIIFVYHCHLVHVQRSERRDELLSILWNTYNYYSQFNAQVSAQIKEKRAPIEKKLRDFVKICTWDRDLSYWSVKDTVQKAYKALHKHTKEFENVLKESVSSCLVDKMSEVCVEHVGIWDRPKRATGTTAAPGGAYMTDSQNYVLLVRNIKKYIDHVEKPCAAVLENSILSKVSSLFNKAKTLCKDTMTNTRYPTLVQALDDFVTTIIETNNHLGSLEVDATLTKEKQKSQAKSIIQQKRKALADLFKYLNKIGLSYRTGLVMVAAEEELYDFTILPVNLDAAMSYLKNRRCDGSLSMLWSGCEEYFHRNIARHRRLAAALVAPHADLGGQNLERCKGFAAHLMKLTNSQKKSISKYSRYLCDIRTLSNNLTNILEIENSASNISTLQQKVDLFLECYANMSILLDQFYVLLKSCPEQVLSSNYEPAFDEIFSDSPIVHCYKSTDVSRAMYTSIKSIIANVDKQKGVLHKLSVTIPKEVGHGIKEFNIISQSHIDVTNEAKATLQKIQADIDNLIKTYQFKLKIVIDDNYEPNHPVLRSIKSLSQYLKETIDKFQRLDEPCDDAMEGNNQSSSQIIGQSEDLIATMLLIIQSVYKKHLPEDINNTDNEVLQAIDEIIDEGKTMESEETLQDKHLKECLHDNLSMDTKMMQLNILVTKINSLVNNYAQFIATNKNISEVKDAVMRLIPIIEQTVLFVQYFITQKVAVHRVSCKMLSVLLKIFSDLAMKGFCKPSDIDVEDGEGEGTGTLSSGMGLGEGEGQKDVSERIENQDQLDDAQRPGEEKKDEDRDCKEEEKGVNMTDDFESHLQDVDKKDGADSDQDDDENDADKQMGDIENAAEKLDQQIWGSEDEDNLEEEQNSKEKEEKGKGDSTGEKEMGAKEEEQGTDDGNEGKEKKKKKDINEMNETEVDDDHIDPYHGNQQPMPEPEDFELPDNMDLDGEEQGDDKEGETETENPFEIDSMKDFPEENLEEEKGKDEEENRNGLDVSTDEEDVDQNHENESQDNKSEKNDQDGSENTDDKEEDLKDDKQESQDEDQNTEENETVEETAEDKEQDLPNNPDNVNEEDKLEEKQHEANPQANPSSNDPSAEDKAENAEMETGTDDNVETNSEQFRDEESTLYEQSQEQVGEERQRSGRSELDKSDKGHRGEKQAFDRAQSSEDKKNKMDNKPGKTDQKRTLGEVNEDKHKKAKTLNVEREEEIAEDGGDADNNADKQADAYQHVEQATKNDIQAIDSATKEQAEQQPTLNQDDEEAEQLKEDEEVLMEIDDEEMHVEKSEEIKPEKIRDNKEKNQDKSGDKKDGGEETTGETGMEVEGEVVATEIVPRGNETTYHTRLGESGEVLDTWSVQEYLSERSRLVPGRGAGGAGGAGAGGAWRVLWAHSAAAARALCERLRLVLEPTARSRMAGDYRTGRAINMRRVIPYIASHFRKDRIWLRRSRPARRQYSIAVAVDDSSSMADNRSKELAFESLALVSQALNLLESGDLAVLSFGEKPILLHPFSEQFSEYSGPKIIEQLCFEQTKTKIAELLNFCTVMFEEQVVKSDAVNAKLLLIVGDGRGIMSEGEAKVVQAVRRAKQQGIFLVYVIIDNPENKDSIMDIRRPLLDLQSNKVEFVQYLDTFPFPFYLILRDITALPAVLGDALRQWFELAANTS